MYYLTGFTVTGGGGQILLILFCKGTKSSLFPPKRTERTVEIRYRHANERVFSVS
jgi:hypothetical protein